MGGYGSGRPPDPYSKTVVEDCRQLDIRDFDRRFDIEPGEVVVGTVTWTRGGRQTGAIGWRIANNRLHLTYTVIRGDSSKDVEYSCPLTWTPCNFGGRRPWLICSEKGCGRRVAKLYKPPNGELFLCRECWVLTYKSCQESHKYDRLYRDIAGDWEGMTPEMVKQILSRGF